MVDMIIENNVSTKLIKGRMEIDHWIRSVKRRRPIGIVEKGDMSRRTIGTR